MDVAPSVRARLREHADAMAEAFVDEVRERSRPDAATLRNLRLGARTAVGCFLARLDGPGEPADLALFVAHGRAQQAAGRSLSELLSFYRVGGLAMWRYAAQIPGSARLPSRTIFTLGAEMLQLVDELSVAAAEGFTAQEAQAHRQERARRERLHSLLLSDPPADPGALAAAARAADWPLPARVRVAVAALPVEPAGDVALAGPARVVSGTVDGGRGALVVADDGEAERRLRRAASALGLEPPLALGPAVPPAEAARSAARAAALLAQVHAGTIASAELLRCDDHEVELLLVADPDLARAVARRRLGTLDALAGARRERMLETLDAWLAHPARPREMADRLGLHVQTVRYRIRQLRDVLGDALDDPDERFELALALRADASLRVP